MTTAPAATTPDMIYLSFEGLAVSDEDKREVSGIALPYGEELHRLDWETGATRWLFEKGSADLRDNSTFFYGHDHLAGGMPVGRITAHEHTDEGLRITARISKTIKGDEVYTLLKDGVLDRLSVGLMIDGRKVRLEDLDSDAGPLLVWEKAPVWETSTVPNPAYQSARVESVLSATDPSTEKETTMTATVIEPPSTEGLATSQEVATLAASIDNLERRISTLGASPSDGDGIVVPGSSYGEFLQLVAVRDKSALDFLAYVGGTTADLGSVLKDSWVGDRFRQVEAQRTALNFFARSPLPANGMGVEYGIEGTDTLEVDKQENEGDVLPYGKITWDTDTAPLETFGGWGEMSFQQIQRAPINVVERFFSSLLRKYAQRTELRVNTEVLAAGTALSGGVLDMTTVDGWTRFIIRSARVLKDAGYPLEGILVGFDVFEDLALMRDTNTTDGDRFLNRESGRVSVTGLSGEVFNVPVIPIETGVTADVIRAANKEAIRTYEAPGAPFRLQDDDITNLTHAGSIYGYMATALEVPGAIIKPATA